jgi:hypothetical protein
MESLMYIFYTAAAAVVSTLALVKWVEQAVSHAIAAVVPAGYAVRVRGRLRRGPFVTLPPML